VSGPVGGAGSRAALNLDRIFHALGDPRRRAILEMVSARPHSVTKLAEPLNITLTAVVQHLQILEEAGLVRTEKVGRVRTCSLEWKGFAALSKWIDDRRSMWDRKLERLGDLLDEE
jgi:DNA-binding transcriptional ArsR family regulator